MITQENHNFKNRVNEMRKQGQLVRIYQLDYDLEKVLKGKGLKQSKINKVLVYYAQLTMFNAADLACKDYIKHSSFETALHLTEDEDRNCWKILQELGVIRVWFEKVFNPKTGKYETRRHFELLTHMYKRPHTEIELKDTKQCWVDGIRNFDLSVDEAVIMATLMFEFHSSNELVGITGLSKPTIIKATRHLRDLGLLNEFNTVNYAKCGYNGITDEYEYEE